MLINLFNNVQWFWNTTGEKMIEWIIISFSIYMYYINRYINVWINRNLKYIYIYWNRQLNKYFDLLIDQFMNWKRSKGIKKIFIHG